MSHTHSTSDWSGWEVKTPKEWPLDLSDVLPWAVVKLHRVYVNHLGRKKSVSNQEPVPLTLLLLVHLFLLVPLRDLTLVSLSLSVCSTTIITTTITASTTSFLQRQSLWPAFRANKVLRSNTTATTTTTLVQPNYSFFVAPSWAYRWRPTTSWYATEWPSFRWEAGWLLIENNHKKKRGTCTVPATERRGRGRPTRNNFIILTINNFAEII